MIAPVAAAANLVRRRGSRNSTARAALNDLLSAPDAEFQNVARRVLAKNSELYKRLA
jgi:hypothetical protein